MADATFKVCDRDIGLAGIGIMQPGGKFHPLIFAIVPTESAETYAVTWNAFEKCLVSFAKKFRPCSVHGCAICATILQVLQHSDTQRCMSMDTFRKDKVGTMQSLCTQEPV